MKNIAVIFGGESIEHDVSILTGIQTICALDKTKNKVFAVYIAKNNLWYTGQISSPNDLKTKKLKQVTFVCGDSKLYQKSKSRLKVLAKIDATINCCHGGFGEKGELAGALQIFGVAYTSANPFSAFLTMDKEETKKRLKTLGINQTDYVVIDKYYQTLPTVNFPAIIKPNQGGSSIGISVANDQSELKKAVDFAHLFGTKAIVEDCLQDFVEVNCAVMKLSKNVVVSNVEFPKRKKEFLSFSDKYFAKSKFGKIQTEEREMFCNKLQASDDTEQISPQNLRKIKELCQKIYFEFDLFGVCRIDFLVANDTVFVNEINSVPGSLSNFLFKNRFSFDIMLEKLIEVAIMRKGEENSLLKSFSSNLL